MWMIILNQQWNHLLMENVVGKLHLAEDHVCKRTVYLSACTIFIYALPFCRVQKFLASTTETLVDHSFGFLKIEKCMGFLQIC